MSFDPLRYRTWPYSGTPFFQTVNPTFKNTAGPMGPRLVPLKFEWNVYFTATGGQSNIAVPINIGGGEVQGGILDKIVMVKIDNQNSVIPISVYFPDTQDMVTCPPQTVVTVPAMTNGLRCMVIAQGLQTGFLPQTMVYLYNFLAPSVIDPQLQVTYPQWLGSPLIQRNQNRINTPGFGSPALGDQVDSVGWSPNGGAGIVAPNLFGTPGSSGYIYLTHAYVLASSVLSGGAVGYSAHLGNDVGDILFSWPFTITAIEQSIVLLSLSSMNLKLDARRQWFIAQTQPVAPSAMQGLFAANFVFSQSEL